jgi:hypothetical protein
MRKVVVGTVKKSIDASEPASLSRKERRVCAGGLRGLGGMKRETLRSPMSIPSLSNLELEQLAVDSRRDPPHVGLGEPGRTKGPSSFTESHVPKRR